MAVNVTVDDIKAVMSAQADQIVNLQVSNVALNRRVAELEAELAKERPPKSASAGTEEGPKGGS